MSQTFGERLRAARVEAGMSQSDLAERCGIPKPRLSRYENDHILPSITSLRRLADALDVAQEILLTSEISPMDVFVSNVRSGAWFETDDEARTAAAGVIAKYPKHPAQQELTS
jgi:transcriptional regulator with XRE-family HTH domain